MKIINPATEQVLADVKEDTSASLKKKLNLIETRAKKMECCAAEEARGYTSKVCRLAQG
jgi:hypothetical protein